MSKINEERIAGQSESRLSTPRLGRENIAQPSSSSKGGGSGQGQRDSMRHLCPYALLKKRYKKSGQPVTANRLFFVVVRPKRFELLAYRFVACCSIQLSYERVVRVFL